MGVRTRRLAIAAAACAPAWAVSAQGAGNVLHDQAIHCNELSNGMLTSDDAFGSALAALGDLDRDHVTDAAVGVPLEDLGGGNRGAVWVLFLKPDGTVKREVLIGTGSGGFSGTLGGDHFGAALASVDDLDGDGLRELVVGAPLADGDLSNQGSVWVLFLDETGSVRFEQRIDALTPGGPSLAIGAQFGSAIAPVGDLDGDGLLDLAVGAPFDASTNGATGAVWLLHPGPDGSVHGALRVNGDTPGLEGLLQSGDRFGAALSPIGDLDGDGLGELAVGAPGDDGVVGGAGAVWILYLNRDGTVRDTRKLGAGLALSLNDALGSSLACPGDLDGDGRVELVAGAPGDDDGGANAGAAWVLFLEPDGLLRGWNKLDALSLGLATPIAAGDAFGSALAGLGDVDHEGSLELMVGSPGHDECARNAGEARVLFLDGTPAVSLRNGTGQNRLRLNGGRPPRMGGEWQVFVDCRDKESGLVVHMATDRPADGRILAMGELLVDLSRPHLARARAVHRMTVVSLTYDVPQDPTLLGLSVYSQALVTGLGGPELTNALDTQVVP